MKLELKNINKTYGSTKVLENINFQLNKKECVGIIGPNGAGKSTLFKVVSNPSLSVDTFTVSKSLYVVAGLLFVRSAIIYIISHYLYFYKMFKPLIEY